MLWVVVEALDARWTPPARFVGDATYVRADVPAPPVFPDPLDQPPPLGSISRLSGRDVATLPINPPVVGQFPTACNALRTRTHDSLNPDSVYQEYFLDWVWSAWHMLWLGLELVDAAIRINEEFKQSIYDDRRELVKNIIRGTVKNVHRSTVGVSWDEFLATTPQQFIEPKNVNSVFFDTAGSGNLTKRCFNIRELHIHPVCNPQDTFDDRIDRTTAARGYSADGKTYWPEVQFEGDTQRAFSIALFFQQNSSGVDNAFYTFVHGIERQHSGNSAKRARAEADATCSTVWLASVLFHELLHIVKLPYNNPWNTTNPHGEGHCDFIWISTNTLAQLLMRRYSAALECPACTDRRTDVRGGPPPLFHDGVSGHSFRSDFWRLAPWTL